MKNSKSHKARSCKYILYASSFDKLTPLKTCKKMPKHAEDVRIKNARRQRLKKNMVWKGS